VIDGHPLVRLGVREALRDDFQVHESPNRAAGLELIRDVGSIDVTIVDLRRWSNRDGEGDEPTGRGAIRTLRQVEPGMGIVAHGERAERHIANAALQAGATAYVARTADPEDLRRAVRAAIDQERFVDPDVPPKGSRGQLTSRQRQILQMIANGGSTTAAARDLGLSEEAVKTHTKYALALLGARNRTHAVAIALRESLIE
jgi:DNA-binding NarL/FixJ family response regulator